MLEGALDEQKFFAGQRLGQAAVVGARGQVWRYRGDSECASEFGGRSICGKAVFLPSGALRPCHACMITRDFDLLAVTPAYDAPASEEAMDMIPLFFPLLPCWLG